MSDLIADSACSRCAAGDHDRCDSTSWDFGTDRPGACPCWAAEHDDDSIPAEVVERLDKTLRQAVRAVNTPEQDRADQAAAAYEKHLDRMGGER